MANKTKNPKPQRRGLRFWIPFVIIVGIFLWWIGTFSAVPRILAQRALEEHNLDKAEAMIRNAIRIGPKIAGDQILLARVLRKQGNHGAFDEALQQALALGADQQTTDVERLLAQAQSGSLDKIRARLDGLLISGGADDRELLEAYVNGCLASARLPEAETLLTGWASSFPDDAQPRYYRGRLLMFYGQNQKAAEEFRAALKQNPGHHPAAYLLGQILTQENRPADALESFRSAGSMIYNAAPRIGEAKALRSLGRVDEARNILQSVTEMQPGRIRKSYHRVGDRYEGLPAHLELGNLELADDQYEQALRWLDPAVEANSGDLSARHARGIALRGAGRSEEAARELEAVRAARLALREVDRLADLVDSNPDLIEERVRIGEIYLTHESKLTGEYWLKTALARDATHRRAHQLLADLYYSRAVEDDRYAKLAEHHRLHADPESGDEQPDGVTQPARTASPMIVDVKVPVIHSETNCDTTGMNVERQICKNNCRPSGLAWRTFRTRAWACCYIVVLLCQIGCGDGKTSTESATPTTENTVPAVAHFRFRNITTDANVDVIYRNASEAGVYSILESLGGGTGAFDYDRDGQIDLMFAGGGKFDEPKIMGEATRLYRNRSEARFTEVSVPSGLARPETYTQGCSMGDYNSDGFPDAVITGYGGMQLFRNMGDGTFEEVHSTAGLDDNLWSSSAAWGDLNGDGSPDLYVAHYVDWSFDNNPACPSPWPEHERDVCPPRAFAGLPDVLYLSRGDGTFYDASAAANLREDGKGLGVIISDLDHDGDSDIYVANDMVDNFLYENDGNGHFTETGLLSGTATDFEGRPNGSMGLAVCDYNGDLAPDIWVTNFEQESFALYRNDGSGSFVHGSREAGITALGRLFVGFGTAMGDLDCDGDEDAVISNGHVVYYPTISESRQLPLLLENVGNGSFRREDGDIGDYFAQPHLGRGLAIADLNNDGRLDFVAGHSNELSAVLLNETDPKGSWLRIQLIGRNSSRDAIGARIVLKTTAGEQLRHVVGGGSFQSQHDLRIHFGIPAGAEPITAKIFWPSGKTQVVKTLLQEETNYLVEK